MSVPAEVISTQPLDWRLLDDAVFPTSGDVVPDLAPASVTLDIATYFKNLVEEWKNDTRHLSLVSQRIRHPAYKRIIGMGSSAVPLILAELNRDVDHWFHALSVLSDENPIPNDFAGTIAEAAELWIRWGDSQNF